MRSDTWQALDNLFFDSPQLKADKVEPDDINSAEREIGFVLDHDFKEFIHRYGGAIVGPFPVFGLRKAAPMGKNEASFLDVTRAFRNQGWPAVEGKAVISRDHSGNPVCLDKAGKIWISDHDTRAATVIAANFEAYLRKWCLKLPD